jgi:hypothetical protein
MLTAMSARVHTAVDGKIVDLVTEIVRESMQAFGLRDVSVRAGEDHDGEPVLFIEAEYDLSDTPIDTTVTAALTTKIRDKLWAAGETRFPHIRNRFAEAQKVKPRRRTNA